MLILKVLQSLNKRWFILIIVEFLLCIFMLFYLWLITVIYNLLIFMNKSLIHRLYCYIAIPCAFTIIIGRSQNILQLLLRLLSILFYIFSTYYLILMLHSRFTVSLKIMTDLLILHRILCVIFGILLFIEFSHWIIIAFFKLRSQYWRHIKRSRLFIGKLILSFRQFRWKIVLMQLFFVSFRL